MSELLRIRQAVVVEGRYDAIKLADIVDALILTTNGFAIFRDKEQQALLKQMGRARGLILLTDSDDAGFRIRRFITNLVGEKYVAQAYIPAVEGKERRKAQPSREGTLGVEGIPAEVIRQALLQAGASACAPRTGRQITYTDLYEWGLSGGQGSAETRRALLRRIGLPPRLSKKALCEVLNGMYTYEEFCSVCSEKPVLFWDFHGTLAMHDPIWYDAAADAIRQLCPGRPVEYQRIRAAFHASRLPWWQPVTGEERHLLSPDAWWAVFEREFEWIFLQCDFSADEAAALAKAIRPRIARPDWHRLRPDAVSTLAELQRRGYRQYLLSNNFPETAQVVEGLGLAPYFSGVIVSALVGYDKPQKGIFRLAMEMAGNPQTAYMIGDNPMDDLQGARDAGLIPVGVDRAARAPQAQMGSETLSGLLELFL